jgi:carboxyl-terminal processing protease
VDVASLFVPEGATVVSTDGRTSKAQATFRSERAPLLPDLPVVVLVDGTSASASEIVAGAMQDHERGVVLGTPTYGKGLVQTVRRLPYNTALKMTTAQYFTPDGRAIQSLRTGGSDASAGAGQDGIAPDSTVQPPASDGVVEALKRQAAFFYYANHYAATRDTLAEDFAVTAETVAAFRDWLEAEDRTVRVEAERQARSLRRTLSEDGYEEAVDEAEALEAAVHAATMAAFDDHTAALKAELRRAILARYVDNARVTQATLPHDPQVGAAVSVLRNSAQYKSLLSPDSR